MTLLPLLSTVSLYDRTRRYVIYLLRSCATQLENPDEIIQNHAVNTVLMPILCVVRQYTDNGRIGGADHVCEGRD